MQRIAQRQSSFAIEPPEAQLLITPGSRESSTVWAERDCRHILVMSQGFSNRLAGASVPKPCRPICVARDDLFAIGAESRRQNPGVPALRCPKNLLGVDVP